MTFSLARRAVAELVGTSFLLAAVVGSGIMGDRLAAGNVAIALLANTIATGASLVALILAFGPICGAHFNPAVTLADASQGGLPWREVPAYVAAQLVGAFLGFRQLGETHVYCSGEEKEGVPQEGTAHRVVVGHKTSSCFSWLPRCHRGLLRTQ